MLFHKEDESLFISKNFRDLTLEESAQFLIKMIFTNDLDENSFVQ